MENVCEADKNKVLYYVHIIKFNVPHSTVLKLSEI